MQGIGLSASRRHEIQSLNLPAVLDLKWYCASLTLVESSKPIACRCHRTALAAPLLASADSEGGINLFEYEAEKVRRFPQRFM